MTLRGYYDALPDACHPKTDFVNEVAIEAGVSVQTVRNWIRYGMRPSRYEHVELLSRKTGIAINDLWKD